MLWPLFCNLLASSTLSKSPGPGSCCSASQPSGAAWPGIAGRVGCSSSCKHVLIEGWRLAGLCSLRVESLHEPRPEVTVMALRDSVLSVLLPLQEVFVLQGPKGRFALGRSFF